MKRASRAEPAGSSTGAAAESRRAGGSLWLWVAAGFLFLALLWTAMFVAARHARIESVPLAAPAGGDR